MGYVLIFIGTYSLLLTGIALIAIFFPRRS